MPSQTQDDMIWVHLMAIWTHTCFSESAGDVIPGPMEDEGWFTRGRIPCYRGRHGRRAKDLQRKMTRSVRTEKIYWMT